MSGDAVSGATRGKSTSPCSRPYRGTLIIITNKQANHPDPILAQDLPRPRPRVPALPHGRRAVRVRERKMAARRAEHPAGPGVWRAVVGVGRACCPGRPPTRVAGPSPSFSPSHSQHQHPQTPHAPRPRHPRRNRTGAPRPWRAQTVAPLEDLFDFKATLVKRVRLDCSKPHPGHSWESDRVLGEAIARKVTVDTEPPRNGRGPRVMTTIYACLNGGVEQGETTWALMGSSLSRYAVLAYDHLVRVQR